MAREHLPLNIEVEAPEPGCSTDDMFEATSADRRRQVEDRALDGRDTDRPLDHDLVVEEPADAVRPQPPSRRHARAPWERDVNRCQRALVEVPEPRRAGVAERPVAAERLDGGEPPPMVGELGVAERVDAAVHGHEPPPPQTCVDGVGADAVVDEEAAGEDAVMGCRERRHQTVVVELTGHMPVEAPSARNSPPAPGVAVRAATAPAARP